MKKGDANMIFKKRKSATYRSRRSPQLTPRFPQATLVKGRDEDLHSVDSIHFPTACSLISKHAATRNASASVTCANSHVRISLAASYVFTLGTDWCRHQTLFRDSHI